MGIRLYAIVEANGEVYTRLLPLCLVLGLEFGTLSWLGNRERRLNNAVQENKDKSEPRKMYCNLHLSIQASIISDVDDLQEKASMFCHTYW